MSKAVAIIQARMSSNRLPGKVMLPLAGKPMIWHIWNRARQCREVSEVVVATSNHESDDGIAVYCRGNQISCIRGPLENVLERFLMVIEKYPCDYIVRITGDCPLIHPEIIDEQLRALKKFKGDIIWCFHPGDILEGQGALAMRVLELVKSNSTDPEDLEHVGSPFIAQHPELFRIVEFLPPPNLVVDGLRLTVDEHLDYKLMSAVYEEFWPRLDWVPLEGAVSWLNRSPEIARLNAKVTHKGLNKTVKELKRKWASVPKVGTWAMEN